LSLALMRCGLAHRGIKGNVFVMALCITGANVPTTLSLADGIVAATGRSARQPIGRRGQPAHAEQVADSNRMRGVIRRRFDGPVDSILPVLR